MSRDAGRFRIGETVILIHRKSNRPEEVVLVARELNDFVVRLQNGRKMWASVQQLKKIPENVLIPIHLAEIATEEAPEGSEMHIKLVFSKGAWREVQRVHSVFKEPLCQFCGEEHE